LDFQLPKRFEALYESKEGRREQVVMIHRAIVGSLERFIGVLIEHFAGKFPLWLNPAQARILPIADRHLEYADKIAKKFFDLGIRIEVDRRVESTPKKVRDAELDKVNYILVVGDKEVSNSTVNVRTRDNVIQGEKKVDSVLKELADEIRNKR
jgi:threonyl-tRNA synthetase